MIKRFCDCCGIEVTEDNNGKNMTINHGKHRSILVGQIQMKIEGMESDFDLCKYCVIDVIRRYDDRPKSD